MQEIELKFLNIDKEEIKQKLMALGANFIYSSPVEDVSFKSVDTSHGDTRKKLIRIRKVDNTTKLTYKGPKVKSKFKSREELEVEIDNFELMAEIFTKLGYTPLFSSKHRTHYELGDIAFEIDEWDGVPPFLEIETQSEDDMVAICKRLDLTITDGSDKSIPELYPDLFPEN